MPPKVVLTRKIPSNVLDKYVSNGQIELIQWDKDSPADPQWLKSQIKNADAMIVALQDAISEDLLSNSSPSLKVISTFSVGFDHVDLKAMKERNLRLGYTPFVLDQAVAELTLTLMLNLTRQVPRAARVVREGEWNKNPWSPLAFCGPSLQGKTIGFLGFGNIAQTLVLLLRAFRPGKVIYTTSSPKPFDLESQDFSTLGNGGYSLSNDVKVENEPDKDDLARNSDVLIILASLNSSTKHIINSDFLKKMKKTAYIVNVSRGPLVDTEALAKSLEADEIAGAGLDVVENEPNIPSSHPLLSSLIADKVMILPHIASATNETRQAMADLACNNALGALEIDGMEMVQEKKL